MFILYEDYNCQIYGIFTTVEGAKAFVREQLGVTVEWSDPKHTVTRSMSSQPRARKNYHIQPAPVDPTTFENRPYGFAASIS